MASLIPMYRIFRREGEAASVRPVIVALVLVAIALTTIGVIRVTRQHEVLRLGFELSKRSEEVRKLRETRRQLELEHATLGAPDRIRKLATQLGMTSVAPDRIRAIEARPAVLSANAAHADDVAERTEPADPMGDRMAGRQARKPVPR